MKKIADKHDMVCLLHEKPFAGVNGSGKHDNWSLDTDTGKNLFKPGKTPARTPSSCCFWPRLSRVWTSIRTFSGPRWPSPATITVWALPKHLPQSSPSFWVTNWMPSCSPSSAVQSSRRPANAPSRSAWTPCPPFPRTTRTGTAPLPWPSPATSLSSACWLQPVYLRSQHCFEHHHGGGIAAVCRPTGKVQEFPVGSGKAHQKGLYRPPADHLQRQRL